MKPLLRLELIAPVQNKLCIDNNVNFDWSDATDANNDANYLIK